MVVMQVAEQEIDVGRHFAAGKRPPGRFEPAARVDDEQTGTEPNLETTGVASVNDRFGTGNRERSARASKTHGQNSHPGLRSVGPHRRFTALSIEIGITARRAKEYLTSAWANRRA